MKKSELKQMIREEIKNSAINEWDEWANTRTQSKNIFRMLKQNKTKKDQAEIIWQEFNKYFKIKGVVNAII